MTREYEYEVLKRHDVYVVRKVGSDRYAARFYHHCMDGVYGYWGMGHSHEAHEFSWKWRAILHARILERADADQAKCERDIESRKSATEVRVWR